MVCGKQLRGKTKLTSEKVWNLYLNNRQPISEISEVLRISLSTAQRRLKEVGQEWKLPSISGASVFHLDVTYLGRNTGVLLVLEAGNVRVLYMAHIAHEHIYDYEDAVRYISK